MKNILYKRLLVFCALLMVFAVGSLQAQKEKIQTTEITGQVLGENGQPMPGVTVKSWVAQSRTLTDAEGKFTVSVARDLIDKVTVDEVGYDVKVTEVKPDHLALEPIVLVKKDKISGNNVNELPYGTYANERTTGSVITVTGDELVSYPSPMVLEALAGRVPGLVVNLNSNIPGSETATAYIRGSAATIYIDGIKRDITGLSTAEVEKVEIFKDFPGRAMLGISAAGPVIWITTHKGTPFNKTVSLSAEMGMRTPTSMPEYLDSYNYATLLNEALVNDGLAPRYSDDDLAAYQNQANPARYPDIDYYGNYVAKSSPFRKANLQFSGGDDRVTYFSMFDYIGNNGLETTGESIKNNLYKIRGNVNIRLNDYMSLGVNIAGAYQKLRYPNSGGGANVYNMFDILSTYPSNAHPIYFDDKLIISDDFPVNVDNELIYSGFGEGGAMNAQNSAVMNFDLNKVVKGLTAAANASFDVSNNVLTSKGGTAALYRMQTTSSGADTAVRVVEAQNVAAMSLGNYYVLRRTSFYGSANYQREFGKSAISADAAYYMAVEEVKVVDDDYQPAKNQDLSMRANYAFDGRYVAQVDLAYSGSGRMPEGKRFGFYPTASLAWVMSNEGFLEQSKLIDYLKLYASYGIMGVNDYSLAGYNPFYLNETLWRLNGTWRPGISGNTGTSVNNYNIVQAGTEDFVLPKKSIFNLGAQGELFGKAISFQIEYFNEKNYDKISNLANSTPSIIGSPQFLPAVNYGEDMRWGVDGMLQYTKSVGDFGFSLGVNGMYMRSKYLVVDEPDALEEYQKLAGKDMDLFWLYESEGLYQSEQEIETRNIPQSWGAVQPGDIRYADYNNDNVVDEYDIHTTDAHSPRFFYGVNLSVSYKGLSLTALGQGVADGDVMLRSSRYFWVNGTKQNYSELMLDRFPVTNNYPRLTTVSLNNYQESTFWVNNAAYFRLKNVELSYSLPVSAARTMGMTNFRIFARGTNMFVLSDLKKYSIDPENINAGITGYPMFQTVTFGLSCKF